MQDLATALPIKVHKQVMQSCRVSGGLHAAIPTLLHSWPHPLIHHGIGGGNYSQLKKGLGQPLAGALPSPLQVHYHYYHYHYYTTTTQPASSLWYFEYQMPPAVDFFQVPLKLIAFDMTKNNLLDVQYCFCNMSEGYRQIIVAIHFTDFKKGQIKASSYLQQNTYSTIPEMTPSQLCTCMKGSLYPMRDLRTIFSRLTIPARAVASQLVLKTFFFPLVVLLMNYVQSKKTMISCHSIYTILRGPVNLVKIK